MKILIVNKSSTSGGAAVAANRLFYALKESNTEVKMLVEDPIGDDQETSSLSNSFIGQKKALFRFIKERLYFLPFEKNKQIRYKFSPAVAGADISQHPLVEEADIIHLHWINHGFLSLRNLEQLFKLNKPIVWTMHDMWPFTGGCHYADDCNHYINNCGNCPFLKRSNNKDLSYKIHQKKMEIWNKANIHPVSCSKWLGTLAQSSSLLKSKKVSSIPNPIDTDQFEPKNMQDCRNYFGLPLDKKLVLFGAADISDPRKGANYLMDALHILNKNHPQLSYNIELVIFGKTKDLDHSQYPYKVHAMNFISGTSEMVQLYNSADVFILPSLQDNLPNTVMEAQACGIPVVSFNVGGVPEMIEDNKTGFLAPIKDSNALANNIHKTLFECEAQSLKKNARNYVVNHYSNSTIAQKYNNLYANLL